MIYRLWQNRPRLINNPVILRELVDRLRKASSFYYLSVFLVCGVLMISIFWYQFVNNYYRGASWNYQIRSMFLILNVLQGLTVTMLIPLLSATIIITERERETWDLIRTTPLNLASIIFGKFFSAVLFVWLLLLSLIPIYGLFLTSGGVSPQEIGFIFLLFSEIVIVVGIMGLFCSIYCKRAVRAVSLTYLLSFIYMMGIYIVRPLLCEILEIQPIIGFEAFISPLIVSIFFFSNSYPPGLNSYAVSHPFQVHILLVLGLIAFLLFLSFRKLNRQNESLQTFRASRRLGRQSNTRLLPESLEERTLLKRFPPGKNPVFYKDRRETYGGWQFPVSLFFLFIFSIILLIWAGEVLWPHSDNNSGLMQFMLAWAVFLPITMAPYAANSIRSEVDRNTFDLLLSSTLTSWQIVWGKLKVGFRLFQWRLWGFLLLPFTLFYLEGQNLDLLFGSLIIFNVTGYFFLSLGLFSSSLHTKTTMAYAMTVGIALLLYFMVPLFVGIAAEEFHAKNEIYPLSGFLSPFFMIINFGSHDWQWQGFGWYNLVFIQAVWMIGIGVLLNRQTRWNIRRTKTR